MQLIEGGVHVILSVLVLAWGFTATRNFAGYWHAHRVEHASALALLRSEVCTDPNTRLSVGNFDQCSNAQSAVSLRPFHRAVFSVAARAYLLVRRPATGLLASQWEFPTLELGPHPPPGGNIGG